MRNLKLAGILGLIVLGCARGPAQVQNLDTGSQEQAPFADPNRPQFQEVFRQIIQPKCAVCHSAAGGNRGGLNLESYAAVKGAITLVRDAVATGFMPPRSRPPLSPEEKAMFLRWIDQGALE